MRMMKENATAADGEAHRTLLLIDDDPVVCEILLQRIADSCPLVKATAISQPVAPPGYDIYVVDLNFADRQEGVRLAESIATTTPQSQIFLLSSYLEVEALKRAMGVQCSGAYDKRNPEDVAALLRAISEVAAEEPKAPSTIPKAKKSLIGDMTALIREWNRRISAEQSREG